MSTDQMPEVMLHVPLALADGTWDTDFPVIAAIGEYGLPGFTHILLNVPSYQQYPLAIQDARVLAVKQLAEREGCELVWGRWLWDAEGSGSNELSHIQPSYYAAAIARLRLEGELLGAEAVALDVEPYGDSPQRKEIWGHPGPSPAVMRQMRCAVEQATDVVGPADIMKPHGGFPFQWPLAGLGNYRVAGSGTFCSKPPDWPEREFVPPKETGLEYRFEYWNMYVRPLPAGDPGLQVGNSSLTTLTVSEALETVRNGFPILKARHPTLRGLRVFTDKETHMRAFVRDWKRAW